MAIQSHLLPFVMIVNYYHNLLETKTETVSVSVSVLTLTFISVDRWYAICFPLRFISTTSRAKISIIIIWILSFLIDIPELIVLEAVPPSKSPLGPESIIFTQCAPSWDLTLSNQVLKMVLLYIVPLLFMSVAYIQIVRVLWTPDNIPNNYSSINLNKDALHNKRRVALGNTTESQIRSRRKAAKMLVAVVIMFALCYFPVHMMNILRIVFPIPQEEFIAGFSIFTHWLCYANSAINPIIYNFMSGNFRREFKRAFKQCHKCGRRNCTSDVGLASQNDFVHSFHRRTSAFSSRRTKTTSFVAQLD